MDTFYQSDAEPALRYELVKNLKCIRHDEKTDRKRMWFNTVLWFTLVGNTTAYMFSDLLSTAASGHSGYSAQALLEQAGH